MTRNMGMRTFHALAYDIHMGILLECVFSVRSLNVHLSGE